MPPRDPIVTPPCGNIRGRTARNGRSCSFLGIPFATPPVGDLRWRPPQPLPSWTRIRDAGRFAPAPVQKFGVGNPLFPFPDEIQSEDCLYLNVWTPNQDNAGKHPVIVWIYPGAFQNGSGSAEFFRGERWAEAGIVFVTFNYRLGKIGFLAHPELGAESEYGLSGNYGLLDQIAALEWVQENIAAFGGDPDCVTLFGASSGASTISLLMTADRAAGLFHRAIAESGGSFGPLRPTTGIGDCWQDLPSAERSGETWARDLGALRLKDLRQLDVDTLRLASIPDATATGGVFDAARPIIDGQTLKHLPRDVFLKGGQSKVPLLVGSASNEAFGLSQASTLETYEAQARYEFGARADRFLELYPATTDEEAATSAKQANGHRLFTWQNWAWANLHARSGQAVYYYQFSKAPPVREHALPDASALGAYHCASIFYSFGKFHLRPEWGWTQDDEEFSRALLGCWASFARSGTVTEFMGIPWNKFDPSQPEVMLLDIQPQKRSADLSPRLRFWDNYYAE
ncbi:MAG: carboxylesterase family protein [Hyphomonas sp.]|nr:carboxylesterase family protein [Hyphomonas sp.]